MYPPDQHSPYFDPDTPSQWTYAMRVDAARNEHESPTHIPVSYTHLRAHET